MRMRVVSDKDKMAGIPRFHVARVVPASQISQGESLLTRVLDRTLFWAE